MKSLTRDKKRDEELIEDYQSGMETHEINGKYKVSTTRIYQILKFYNIPKDRKNK